MENLRLSENYFPVEKLKKWISEENEAKARRMVRPTLPVLIQLAMHPDETYVRRSIDALSKSSTKISFDVCDSFRSTLPMFVVRHQRFHLFDFLLTDLPFAFDWTAEDQRGNNVLHYAVIYWPDDLGLFLRLLDHFVSHRLDVDARNAFGFTPMLLAMFCGRCDVVLQLVQRAKASAFARDDLLQRNLFDYFANVVSPSPKTKTIDRRSARFLVELHQAIPSRHDRPTKLVEKNFFETIFSSTIDDEFRSTLSQLYRNENSATHRQTLLRYLVDRYSTSVFAGWTNSVVSIGEFHRRKPEAKSNLHDLLDLYEEKPRPKAIPPPVVPLPTNPKTSPLKRLSARLSLISLASRPSTGLRATLSLPTNEEKENPLL